MKPIYLVVTPFFPSMEKFYGSFVYDQVAALKRLGQNVIVFMPSNQQKDSYEFEGIRVIPFKSYGMPSYILNGFTDGVNIRYFKKALIHENIDIDSIGVVHCHTLQCACYGNLVKQLNPEVISIIQYHDLDPFTILNGKFNDCYFNLKYKIVSAFRKLERFDYHVCVSERVLDNLTTFPHASDRESYRPYLDILQKVRKFQKLKLKIKNSIVLINGVNKQYFKLVNKESTIHDESFTIGCIGNYIPLKNHKLLVDAVGLLLKKSYNIRLLFIGDNPESGKIDLANYIEEKRLSNYITFHPPVEHRNLSDVYEKMDMFVLPSLFEGLGCVYLEAYACGVPFIGVKNQGIDDVLCDDKDKWLISGYSAEELASKIQNFIDNPCKQMVNQSIDIDILVKDFVKKIGLNG